GDARTGRHHGEVCRPVCRVRRDAQGVGGGGVTMRLWLIERIGPVDYDEHDSAIIRAETEEEARRIANRGLYPRDSWDAAGASCTLLDTDGLPHVIVSSFNAG